MHSTIRVKTITSNPLHVISLGFIAAVMRLSMENDAVPHNFLSRGDHTFTLERLGALLRSGPFSYDYRTEPGARHYSSVTYGPPEIRCEIDTSFFLTEQKDDGIRCFTNQDSKLRAVKFCQELLGDGTPESISVTRLDALFSTIFSFRFEPLDDSQSIVKRASDLLERMPAWPVELPDIPLEVPPEYRASSIASTASTNANLWEKLQTTTYVSSNVLRAALSAAMDPECMLDLLDMTDIIATLLEIVSQLASEASDTSRFWRSLIARAFLWTSWQHCQMIYYHLAASNYLIEGSSDGKKGKLTMRGTFPSPGLTMKELSKQRASLQKSPYMCGRNFEILRTSPVCIGADFRRFHQLYNAAFKNHPARCLKGQLDSCRGNSPESCRRFQGMAIEDQSAHSQTCLGGNCRRLIWDEKSYRSVTGGRAVSITLTESHSCEALQYCSASDRTLAISHVWSHGQGGRPETGINYCLHFRYSRIATSLGCDSYWIDTTCIPHDHQLRAESIAKINEIFLDAKVMLICDRDIMEIDISNMTPPVCEVLLVTTIASDWNVRAWTFFEAFRARRTLHLLCRNNAVTPLKEIIEVVHPKGALDIGNLLLAMPHFLPSLDDRGLVGPVSQSRKQFKEGHMPIEFCGSLLSHRAFSRPGDDFVIWSLLMSEETIFYSAETFWKSMQGHAFQSAEETGVIFSSAAAISTGFLVSSTPRLKAKGLSWAPASPALHPSTELHEDSYNGYDGGESYKGYITVDGLVADWLLFKFDGHSCCLTAKSILSKVWTQSSDVQYSQNLAKIRARYLRGYRWGAIFCPVQVDGIDLMSDVWWNEGGRLRRTVLAVCATNEPNGTVAEKYTFNSTVPTRVKWDCNREVVGWEWRGTYVWDDAEPLPQLRRAKKFLIA